MHLLPLLLTVAPMLAEYLFGQRAGTVVDAAAGVLRQVTGSADPAAAEAAMAADPEKAAQVKIELARIAAEERTRQRQADLEEMKAVMADLANARASMQAAVVARSPIAYGPVVLSVLVTLLFGAVLVMVFVVERNYSQAVTSMLNILFGSLIASFNSVVAFWLGSSRGSAAKDEKIAGLTTAVRDMLPVDAARPFPPPQGARP